MKKSFLLAITALAVLMATSCQKEELGRVLTATIEQYEHNGKGDNGGCMGGAKAYINGENYACWEAGDLVNINGTQCTIRFEEGTQGAANSAVIDGASLPADVPLLAFYPASQVSSWNGDNVTISLPQEQHYEETTVNGVPYQKINNPMAAYCPEGSNELKFRNLGALLKVTVQNPENDALAVKAIFVKGDEGQMLSGTAKLVLNNQHLPVFQKISSGSTTVGLSFDSPAEISAHSSKSFYIVVPAPSTFTNLTIYVVTDQNEVYRRESILGQVLPRNQIGAFTYAPIEGDVDSVSTILYTGSIEGFHSDAFGDARVIFNAGGVLLFDSPLTTIGYRAFQACESLESITLPKEVTTIGDYAFSYCYNLNSIDLPAKLTSLGTYTFSESSGLSSITLPANLTSIGNFTFFQCRSLSSITLPANLNSINEAAFAYCTSLSEITLPGGVTSIGKYAFSYCNFASIYLPESLTSILECAFARCENLMTVYVSRWNGDSNDITQGDHNMFLKCPLSIGIFVQNDAAMAAYKSAEGWSEYEDKILSLRIN